MKIRNRFFAGKLILVSCFLVLVLWLYGGDNSSVLMNQNLRNPLSVSNVMDTFHQMSGILTWHAQTCISIVGNFRITADFTLNTILDRMKLTFVHGGIHAIDILDRPTNISKNSVVKKEIDDEPLHVIVIPHSHNDPGWKKTYMQYFEDQTTHILSLMVEKLNTYPDMTFIWVESCFLNTWWANQTAITRSRFKELVKGGRLEIVSGQWVAPDEASTHYFALLDQLIEGHYWVKTNLGVVPETSLNFDQFGYSASLPYFMKKSGLKNVLIKRIHRGVKQLLGEKNWMTFNWRQFWDPEGHDDIFAQVDTYEWMSISDSCGPDRAVCRGLDFSVMPDLPIPGSPAASKPFISDKFTRISVHNLHDFVQKLVKQFRLKSGNYKQKVMMLPHGGDFHYSEAWAWDKQYKNMKLFMNYVNDHRKEFNVNIRFGTIKDYFSELERQTVKFDLKYPVVSGDFFTYTENTEYWTGYFTTRQFDKRLGREVQESLRAAELFASVALNDDGPIRLSKIERTKILSNLVNARQDLGIFQHHDAITGTSQAHVATDYEKRLSSGFSSTQEVLSSVIQHLIYGGITSDRNNKLFPALMRTGHDTLTKRATIPVRDAGTSVILVNAFTQSRREIVTLTVDKDDITIIDSQGESINFDISPPSDAGYDVVFEVDFPPVSLLAYTVKQNQYGKKHSKGSAVLSVALSKNFLCENEHVNATFSKETGSPLLMCYKEPNFCTSVKLDWIYYPGRGGAYTMMSNGIAKPAYKDNPKVVFFKGETVCRVQTDFEYFSVTVSLPLTKAVSGRSLRVKISSDLSKMHNFNGDLAMRVNSSINSGRTFYVDSNGVQLMGRKFRTSLPFDGNVYPMSSMALIEDSKMRLVVHSAQPHGVVSRMSGVLDFMLDRIAPRPEMDMPEPVVDSKPTVTMLFIEFQSASEYEKLVTIETTLPSPQSVYLNDLIQHPVYTFYSQGEHSVTETVHTFLKQQLSCDVVLANVKNLASENLDFKGTSMTLFRRGVSCSASKTANFCPLFENANIQPGNILGRKSSKSRQTTEMFLSLLLEKRTLSNNEKVHLKPMDIKSFHLHPEK